MQARHILGALAAVAASAVALPAAAQQNAADSCKYFTRYREACPDRADAWQRDLDRVQPSHGVHIGIAVGDLSKVKPVAFSLAPVIAVILAFAILGEPLGARKVVAVGLVVAGVVMLTAS